MNTNKYILGFAAAFAAVCACTKVENMEVQKFSTMGDELYDAQYFKNIREWKETPHAVTYVYYAAYSTLEGAETLQKNYTNMGERFIGLPDSLDFVNLWMGVPSNDPKDEHDYAPQAYEDMQYCRELKGTKFIIHADAAHWNHKFTYKGVDYDLSVDHGQEALEAYAGYYVDLMYERNVDGIDWDFEGWPSDAMVTVAKKAGERIGPQGSDQSKYLIVDYYGYAPGADIEPYVSFMVCQAYSVQDGGSNSAYLDRKKPSYLPAEKYVVCEQWNQGSNTSTGGKAWNNDDGSAAMTFDENGNEQRMYSLEAYSRYCLAGRGGGFGAFYIDSDYFFSKGCYYNLRRCIQIANPSIH